MTIKNEDFGNAKLTSLPTVILAHPKAAEDLATMQATIVRLGEDPWFGFDFPMDPIAWTSEHWITLLDAIVGSHMAFLKGYVARGNPPHEYNEAYRVRRELKIYREILQDLKAI